LRSALIFMVQQNQYGGLAIEDPNEHLLHFLEISNTVKVNGVSDDSIRMRLFPFSLKDKAKQWYQTLVAGSVASWEDLAHKFLYKFFPPGVT
ncbi:hypothetical protein, partial [Pseudomonas aeruginosa]|uniref:hypothetical protein n=1 Tax=Pseudomonas aeruginosa TaxID=287 RepID=UPI00307DC547